MTSRADGLWRLTRASSRALEQHRVTLCAVSDRRQFHSFSRNKSPNGSDDSGWVPPAYRGVSATKTRSTPSSTLHNKKHGRNHDSRKIYKIPPRAQRREDSESRKAKLEEYTIRKRKEKIDKQVLAVKNQISRLARTAIVYKRKLIRHGNANDRNSASLTFSLGELENKEPLDQYLKVLKDLSGFLHFVDDKSASVLGADSQREEDAEVVEDVFELESLADQKSADLNSSVYGHSMIQVEDTKGIIETEPNFREICIILQEIATVASNSVDWESNISSAEPPPTMFIPLDICLAALDALNKTREHRKQLVDLAIVKQSQARRDRKDGTETGWMSSVQDMLGSMMGTEKGPKPTKEITVLKDLEHTQAQSGATLDLYERLLENFLTNPDSSSPVTATPDLLGRNSKASSDKSPSEGNQPSIPIEFRRELAHRLISFIEQMEGQRQITARLKEESFVTSLQNRQKLNLLSFLCQVGSLKSAQTASRISFQDKKQRNSDAMVWRAYLEAAKNDTSSMTDREESVRQLYRIWLERTSKDSNSLNLGTGTDLSFLVLASIAELGGDDLDAEFRKYADTIVKGALGKKSFGQLKRSLRHSTDLFSGIEKRYMPLVDSYARVQTSCDLRKAKDMLRHLLLHTNEQLPTVATTNSYIKGVLNSYQSDSSSTDEIADDIDFAMKLLDACMKRRESDAWPTQETFDLLSRLITVSKPKNAGKCLLEWCSHFEIRSCFDNAVQIKCSDYNRVLWGLWKQHEETKSAEQEGLNFCEEAWSILRRMDSRSMPLLMSAREIRRKAEWKHLYHTGDQPNRKTYDLVLEVCATTKSPTQARQALEIAQKVVAQAERRRVDLDESRVERCVTQLQMVA